MRQSQLLLTTLREAPAEAEVISHQLMLRAGFIRQLAAGMYTYMPLGRRVLRKVEQIVREEMDRAGASELLMPMLQHDVPGLSTYFQSLQSEFPCSRSRCGCYWW